MTCVWTQCTNIARDGDFVCVDCAPERDRRHREYKEVERRVVAALMADEPRGDATEAQKVIARLGEAIRLRQAFTSRLDPAARDVGHEYRVTRLFVALRRYQLYLGRLVSAAEQQVVDQKEECVSEDRPDPVSLLREEERQVVAVIKSVEDDPFSEYDELIKAARDMRARVTARLAALPFTFSIFYSFMTTTRILIVHAERRPFARAHSSRSRTYLKITPETRVTYLEEPVADEFIAFFHHEMFARFIAYFAQHGCCQYTVFSCTYNVRETRLSYYGFLVAAKTEPALDLLFSVQVDKTNRLLVNEVTPELYSYMTTRFNGPVATRRYKPK